MGVLDGGLVSFICDLLVFDDEELPPGLDLLWGLTDDDDGPAIALELEGFR
jgi:hypothetical protein